MTFEQLKTLCTLVDTRSFRATAERVHRSQPAVSQQIKALERRLGQVLIDRKTCLPTPAGTILYGKSREIIRSLENLAREIEEFDETIGHELLLGTSDTIGLYVLPKYVRAFVRAMPPARLVILSRSSEEVVQGVTQGDLDMGIVTLGSEPPELESVELFAMRFALAAPVSHPFAMKRRIAIDALQGAPFVWLDEKTRTGAMFRDFLAAHAVRPRFVLDSGSFEVIKRYVAEGIGLAFLPSLVMTEQDKAAIRLIPLDGLPRVRIGAVWRRGAYLTRSARRFLAILSSGTDTAT